MLSCVWTFPLSVETILLVFYGSIDDLLFGFAKKGITSTGHYKYSLIDKHQESGNAQAELNIV